MTTSGNGMSTEQMLRNVENAISGATVKATAIEPGTWPSNEPPAEDDIPRIGSLAGAAIEQSANTAAQSIREVGTQIMELAHSLKREADLLADAMVKEGRMHSDRLAQFTAVAQSANKAMVAQREHLAQFEHAEG